MEVDIVWVAAVDGGFGGGELLEDGDCGFFCVIVYPAGGYDFGDVGEVSVLVLVGRGWFELEGSEAGSGGFGGGQIEVFDTERGDLGLQEFEVETCIEHSGDEHVTCAAGKAIEVCDFHKRNLSQVIVLR